MMTFTEFFSKFSTSDLDQMITDYELFRKQGFIDDCFLRSAAQEWCENIGAGIAVVLVMTDLAMESYKTRYHQLRGE
jgi:hypothetical protein